MEFGIKDNLFEQFVYAQSPYDPESGTPTAKIAMQSPLWGLGSPEEETVDLPPHAMLDGLALTRK